MISTYRLELNRVLPLAPLRYGLLIAGEVLLYLYFAMPFGVEKALALISLQMPGQAILFGTVWPYFSVVNLIALLLAFGLMAVGYARSLTRNKAFVIYCAINAVGICLIPFLTPRGQPIYWDYALEFARLASFVTLASVLLAARRYDPAILVRIVLIAITIPLLTLLVTDPIAFMSDRMGRLNGPGLEITSTGHMSAIATLLGLSLKTNIVLRVALCTVGLVVLVLSGSRFAFLFCFVAATVVLWSRTRSSAKRISIVLAIAALGAFAIFVGSSGVIAGGRLGTFFGDGAALQEEYAVGRGIAFAASVAVLMQHPLGYVDSDWAIQQDLVRFGFPSHTHSHLMQSYLRFGPMVLVFWAVILCQARSAWRRRSPFAICLWFILAGALCDYYGFVTKAMVVVFVILALDHEYQQNSAAALATAA